ncbi:hypothetical protein EV384_6347 [Micromonospora kangleipakensis]|uniref:Lipoprotein n=1 Tax=Micromonospora kangleipakensis TaxID=1077942 RepID=A0A4V2GDX6_9ACTN|nr:hypothetical protein [Micromonospora kangleipakensis]RZU77616.1 hypothetical protein EV384_6347 [Micromonospora kangleipakensis]
MRKTIITIAALGVTLLAAACGTEGTPDQAGPAATGSAAAVAASPAAAPKEPVTVEAAKTAAQKEFDAYAAGDWKGAWDLWTAEGKAAISRDEYARLHTECKTITGLTFEITGTRLEGEGKAVVTWKRSIVAGTADMRYEDGQWRYQPDADSMADYAKGVDKVLAERRAAGSCEK